MEPLKLTGTTHVQKEKMRLIFFLSWRQLAAYSQSCGADVCSLVINDRV